MAALKDVTSYLDATLRVGELPDYGDALNGLQLEAGAEVRSVACAVDAGEGTVEKALAAGADLLVVHHGLFWGGNRPVVGAFARKLRRCFEKGMSIYSAHLPLDVHPELGNNVGVLRALGLAPDGAFAPYKTLQAGLTAPCDLSLDELLSRLRAGVGEVHASGAGPKQLRRIGVVTGSGGSFVGAAARLGLDALVTGEGAHHTALDAEELGIHLLMCGHYRTEVFGVKALGAALEKQFGLPHQFVAHDTGL